jgi:hypothetical protein
MRIRSLIRPALVKRPSPAMIVAIAALFVALSGTTYAVTRPPVRSVGSIQLQKGAVRSENIAKGAVTRSKLSPGLSVTQLRPSSVHGFRADTSLVVRAAYADRAGHADTAALADGATTATTAGSAPIADTAVSAGSAANASQLDGHDSSFFLPQSTIVDVKQFSLAPNEERVMLQHGPFTLTARCYSDPLTGDDADVLIETTEPHSAFEGFANDADLNYGDPQIGRSVIGVDGVHGLPQFESSADGAAVAPSGAEIRSIVFYVGLNLFGSLGDPGKPCTFGGFAII